MEDMSTVCVWIAELVPLVATLFSLTYGLCHFFKKGKPLFLQSITLAMASYALGTIYHICLVSANDHLIEGFTPAYLGRIGFYMFFITATYGQLDRIVDDRTTQMRRAEFVALLAPIGAALLFIPNLLTDAQLSTKVSYGMIWVPALFAVYFNLKHAIIPDLDFGFIKAIKPYNVFALCLCISELVFLTAWNYLNDVGLVVASVIFGALCICTMISAKKGADKWTI